MDKNTHHGGLLAEQRSIRIFQLYDEDDDGYLSRSELENLVAQLRSRRRESVSRAEVVAAAEEILQLANLAYTELCNLPKQLISQKGGSKSASSGGVLLRVASMVAIVVIM